MNSIVPNPKIDLSFRLATMADLPFMDGLQKKYGKALGYFPTKQFEGYIETGGVLVAEDRRTEDSGLRTESGGSASLSPRSSALSPLGYIISRDRYLKRDELGVIYQLCVAPGVQRGYVGAALVREAFNRSAYGCRLYCCWCAQDLDANYFWESLGFVPLAFRVGSDRKRRVHIFWQKKIYADDQVEGTKWWYPFQTTGGAIRADRIVLPIPPGVHWSEVRAPEVMRGTGFQPVLPGPKSQHGLKTRVTRKVPAGPGPGKVGILVGGRIKYIDRPGYVAPLSPAVAPSVPLLPAPEADRKVCPARDKIDPKFLAAARELRDRYLETVNDEWSPHRLVGGGKYQITRDLNVAFPSGVAFLSEKEIRALPPAA